MTFQAWLQQAIARLAESDSPRRDAEILLGHVTGRARTWILAFGETTLSADEAARLEALLVRRQRGEPIAPQIVSASFEGVRSEVLLHALEDRGIYVSSGSACSSNHPAISGTLKAIGVKKELLDSTLRFSFGMFNTIEEVDYCIGVLEEILPALRRYR